MKKKPEDKTLVLVGSDILTEQSILGEMENVIRELHQTGNVQQAMHVLDVMKTSRNPRGLPFVFHMVVT